MRSERGNGNVYTEKEARNRIAGKVKEEAGDLSAKRVIL
tara:strand:- start:1925 stop:2041 length:117 start_codon:yes stop_codon:yes gene_type:complete